MPDRFSADEARRIFARAARRQHAAPTPDGLSVDDLAEIGREAGLDPALIAAEAAAERLSSAEQRTWHGVPVGIRRSRLMPARISDAEWERVVDRLRAEFKMTGVTEQIGRRREWATAASTSTSGSSVYRVRVEERPEGDLVTIEAPNVSQQLGVALGSVFGGMALFLGTLIGTLKPEKLAEALAFAAVMLLIGVGIYGASFLSAKLSVSRTTGRLDTLLDRIDLISRTDAPAPRRERSALDGPILDPVHLDAEADETVAPRRRARA